MGLKLFRNILFWSFVGLYFILAPAITLYALGYVFQTTNFTFVKTGIISVKSKPENADVFLDGRLLHEKTPTAITGLLPGHYRIQVNRHNYQSWDQMLDVEAEEVTRVERILLAPENPSVSKLVSFPVHAVIPSSGNRFLFLVSHADNHVSLYAFDLKKKKELLLFSEKDPESGPIRSVTILSSFDDHRVLVFLEGDSTSSYISTVISDKPEPIRFSEVLKVPISNVRFHPKDSDKVYYLDGNQLCIFDLKEHSVKTTTIDNLHSFEAVEDKIYYVTQDGLLFSADLDGKQSQNLLPDQSLRHRLFGSEEMIGTYRMFLTAKENAFWLGENGTLLMNRLPYFLDENVTDARLIGESEKLLYWKVNELWLFDLTTPEGNPPSFFEKGPIKTLIWKSKRPILSAQMMGSLQHVLVTTDEAIFLLDLQTALPVSAGEFLLQKFSHRSHFGLFFYFDDNTGELYWIDSSRGEEAGLNKIKLVEPMPFSFSFHFKKPYSAPTRIEIPESA